MSIDWESINASLPFEKNEDEYEQRKALWDGIDVNGNGFLSLAEISKGIRDVIGVDELFDCTPAINRAFHYSKNRTEGGEQGFDYIEFREFRLFLQTLRMFFEFYQAFDSIDEGDDRKINKEEFANSKDAIERWVGVIEDMDAEFDSIDVNEGGEILFSEFVEWAMAKDLNIEVEEFANSKDAIERWVGVIEDMDAEFDSIDVNEGGEILFSEFVEWAMAKDLNIEVEEYEEE
eukprot:TRINITY_DN10009_c0_g1_i1.p1 TRINITY_DN10009_c0_g1~~TRINITY_DN10009_c0_g1_i1.p1  ORF type:complete len:243 (-),score=68.67 TRINITY_DN10009_c0_g1_i1:75-773(-)